MRIGSRVRPVGVKFRLRPEFARKILALFGDGSTSRLPILVQILGLQAECRGIGQKFCDCDDMALNSRRKTAAGKITIDNLSVQFQHSLGSLSSQPRYNLGSR